jgi:hypothetical protein
MVQFSAKNSYKRNDAIARHIIIFIYLQWPIAYIFTAQRLKPGRISW